MSPWRRCRTQGRLGLETDKSVEFVRCKYFERSLVCTCGESPDDLAALNQYHTETQYRKTGWLNDMHRVDWDEQEEVDTDTCDDDEEVFCERCLRHAKGDDWEIHFDHAEDDLDNSDWYVYGDGCDREIEFGWSHPDRGGRIWPAECTDFNPWKCWPEPRYVEMWAKKNWIRPSRGR
jgi:hypothetical protein